MRHAKLSVADDYTSVGCVEGMRVCYLGSNRGFEASFTP